MYDLEEFHLQASCLSYDMAGRFLKHIVHPKTILDSWESIIREDRLIPLLQQNFLFYSNTPITVGALHTHILALVIKHAEASSNPMWFLRHAQILQPCPLSKDDDRTPLNYILNEANRKQVAQWTELTSTIETYNNTKGSSASKLGQKAVDLFNHITKNQEDFLVYLTPILEKILKDTEVAVCNMASLYEKPNYHPKPK